MVSKVLSWMEKCKPGRKRGHTGQKAGHPAWAQPGMVSWLPSGIQVQICLCVWKGKLFKTHLELWLALGSLKRSQKWGRSWCALTDLSPPGRLDSLELTPLSPSAHGTRGLKGNATGPEWPKLSRSQMLERWVESGLLAHPEHRDFWAGGFCWVCWKVSSVSSQPANSYFWLPFCKHRIRNKELFWSVGIALITLLSTMLNNQTPQE